MSLKIDALGDLIWTNEKGKWHREKGPSIIYTDGCIKYHFNDLPHRLDGPSLIYSDGSKHYYINGERYSKEDYLAKVAKL